MYKIKLLRQLTSVVVILTLAACSSSPDEQQIANTADMNEEAIFTITPDDQDQQKRTALTLYKSAKRTMDEGLYNRAIEMFNNLDALFPFGPMSKQIQLDLIYAYYKSANTAQAIASIDRFIRLNPNDKDLDYIFFMRGLVHMGTDGNVFQEFFGIDRADKDLEASRLAFADFKKLISEYPQSKYAVDARKRMVFLLDKMARRELYVAQYYMKQGAYVAAANRGQYVLENYPNSPRIEQALEVMIESYDQLGLESMKNDTLQVLRINYPENNYAR